MTNLNLNPVFLKKVRILQSWLAYYNVPFVITSGYRTKEEQTTLQKRYLSGEKGIYKPATNSKHTAGKAIDFSSPRRDIVYYLAKYLGIKNGSSFNDPVHLYID